MRIAHRGAPWIAPGNTREALSAALRYGIDLVEVDVRPTAEGRLALWHADSIEAEHGNLVIADERFERLRRALHHETDEHLLDLHAAMELAAGRAGLLVDLKADGLAGEIIACARRTGFVPMVVAGRYWESLREIGARAPEIGISFTLKKTWREDTGGPRIEDLDTSAVTAEREIATSEFIRRCHRGGIAVFVWTVDDPDTMEASLDRGADGLISNRCDLFAGLKAPEM